MSCFMQTKDITTKIHYTTKDRGWGLGLSLVKRIVEGHHGGKVSVKSSKLGKGTTFEVVLPKHR